jgi:hypothetical protein
MQDFVFDYDYFISIFPEFETCFSQTQITSKFELVKFLYCGLVSNDLPSEEDRTYLVFLAIAHLLETDKKPSQLNGNIKNIKNRQDSITYAIKDSDQRYDWGTTFYGQMLIQKLDLIGSNGFVLESPDLGGLGDLGYGGCYGLY